MAQQETKHLVQPSQQQWDDAIARIVEQLAQQPNITTVDTAIESLILTGGQYADPSVHALYLQKVPESPGFTRKDVSVYLADLDETALLDTYFQLVHFGGLSIEDSLRLFYTELRLEPLPNKNQLNVLLSALATAFKTNGGHFGGDTEDCVRVYNAMIMLNESLHNKQALGRSRQTEQSFMEVINDIKANNIAQFEEDEMRRIYQSIQRQALIESKSQDNMQRSGVAPAAVAAGAGASYSKYGKASGQNSSVRDDNPESNSMMQQDYNDDDVNPNGAGVCCIIL